jgi:hypothetical protein
VKRNSGTITIPGYMNDKYNGNERLEVVPWKNEVDWYWDPSPNISVAHLNKYKCISKMQIGTGYLISKKCFPTVLL